jgi:16S rRNA (cytidine1402-2'-O)-methyltransferase
MKRGRLFVVPNLLGVVAPEQVLPAHTIAVARGLAHYVVENAKPARAFLQSLAPALPIRQIALVELGEAPGPARCSELLAPVRDGHDLGLLSDAGCPGIADPGALIVAHAHREGIRVIPLVGPSSAPPPSTGWSRNPDAPDTRRSSSRHRIATAHCSPRSPRPASRRPACAWRPT